MPDPPPVPVAAHFLAPYAVVQFDRALTPGVLDVANWFVRHTNLRKAVTAADAAGHVGDTVDLLTAVGGIPDPGPDVVSYSPPPFDVASLTAVPAAAFADFPIT